MSFDAPLTTRRAIILASRVACAYLLFWAADTATYLPQYTNSLIHYWQHLQPVGDGYWSRYYLMEFSGCILRLALELFVAGAFYRCGPRLAGFLLGESEGEAASTPPSSPAPPPSSPPSPRSHPSA